MKNKQITIAVSSLLVLVVIITGLYDIIQSRYVDGYASGEKVGYDKGYDEGKSDGYDEGISEGYDEGYNEGYEDVYNEGY